MFSATQTFTHSTGLCITPIEMQQIGFIFFIKELEEQLGYEDLSKTVRQSESFVEGIEYLVLRENKLLQIKDLVNRTNSIGSVIYKRVNALLMLTEQGLYTALILSRKPNAQIFRRWVTGEVLPSIRKTGIYKLPEAYNNFDQNKIYSKIAELEISFAEQQKALSSIVQAAVSQEKFKNYTLRSLERIEAILSDMIPHDMCESWKKIKCIVDDMTKIYNLSDIERKRYFLELCQTHDVHLPSQAFLDDSSQFYELKDLAAKLSLYSVKNKPHSRFLAALIRHLGLKKANYCISNSGIEKYSDKVVPHVVEWVREKKSSRKISNTKGKNFCVRYQNQICYFSLG